MDIDKIKADLIKEIEEADRDLRLIEDMPDFGFPADKIRAYANKLADINDLEIELKSLLP